MVIFVVTPAPDQPLVKENDAPGTAVPTPEVVSMVMMVGAAMVVL